MKDLIRWLDGANKSEVWLGNWTTCSSGFDEFKRITGLKHTLAGLLIWRC